MDSTFLTYREVTQIEAVKVTGGNSTADSYPNCKCSVPNDTYMVLLVLFEIEMDYNPFLQFSGAPSILTGIYG